jgi:hypothetical protein
VTKANTKRDCINMLTTSALNDENVVRRTQETCDEQQSPSGVQVGQRLKHRHADTDQVTTDQIGVKRSPWQGTTQVK